MHVSIASADGVEINALYDWLRADRDMGRAGEVAAGPQPPGTMGALELVDVVLTHVSGLTTLAFTILAFRQSRSRTRPISITREDGEVLIIDGSPEITADLIVQFLSSPGGAAERPVDDVGDDPVRSGSE